jgi:hypothetical protein
MELRYVGCPYPPGTPNYHEWPHLKVDEIYDVAEIFEMEGHVMVRRPGEKRWPAPGSHLFGLHPEWFDSTSTPIPIVSCGYHYNEFLHDFYGVLLDHPELVDTIGKLRDIDVPDVDMDEDFATWQKREAVSLPENGALRLYELLSLPVPPSFGVFKHVHLADERIGSPFAYAGAFLAELARGDVSTRTFSEQLGLLLYALEIDGFEVTEIDMSFWQGTDGGDRLINAPGGKLVYGTNNPPDMLD